MTPDDATPTPSSGLFHHKHNQKRINLKNPSFKEAKIKVASEAGEGQQPQQFRKEKKCQLMPIVQKNGASSSSSSSSDAVLDSKKKKRSLLVGTLLLCWRSAVPSSMSFISWLSIKPLPSPAGTRCRSPEGGAADRIALVEVDQVLRQGGDVGGLDHRRVLGKLGV
mmetsp:Transcript_20739/g.49839  ORF Transcript_20739/g.49839 Transcript_20739/m.49839 type:complete len:166 (-) Transcript_20739:12-509(-)